MGDEYTVNLYDDLPSFANKENRARQQEILQKRTEVDALRAECVELKDRLGIIDEHLKSVQGEVKTTQQIAIAKEEEVKTESHLQQLALREHGKIEADLKRLAEESDNIRTKNSQIESKTLIAQGRIDAFKEEARINQEELEQWIQAARDKEEDFLVIQRYNRDDDGRVRSMLLEIEKATAIVEGKKNELEQEITGTRALQIELDTTADQFRKLHEERARLLAQWEGTLQKMQSLNDQIGRTTSAFEERKGQVTKYIGHVNEGKKNLEQAENDNKYHERQLTIGENAVAQKHKAHELETRNLLEFEGTVETQRHKVEKLESDTRAYKEQIADLRRKTQIEYDKREAFLQRLEETKNALLTQKDWTEDLNNQTTHMNNFLKKEEQHLQTIERAIDGEKNQIFKLSQEVYQARKNEKSLLAEIQGSQSRAKNLQLKIQEYDKETQKQMELLYNSNFQIQQMERKISRIEGDRTEEEKVELQAQIDQMSEVYASKEATEKMLTQQLHRLNLDLRQTQRRRENLEEQRKDLDIRMTELKLDQESLDKSTVKARSQKEAVLVQINMLRLQVEKLGSQVNNKCDELISLENRRQQLQLSMEERIEEIDGHLAALRTQVKTEEEARHQAVVELQERKRRADTLASKYEVIMGKYKVEGEEVSQSYHIIKFAQEREEVTRRGDELEEQVRVAVRELRGLERAMGKLNGQNTQFRGNFSAVGAGDSDLERKKTLEEQRSVAQQRLNARRSSARAARDEHNAMETAYEQRSARIQTTEKEIAKLQPVIDRLEIENNEMKEKIKRANLALNRAKETHRKAVSVPLDAPYPASPLEMDVEIKMEQGMLDAVVAELSQIADMNREVEPKLNLGLSQMGMKVNSSPRAGPRGLANMKTPSIATPTSSRSGSSNRSAQSVHSMRSGGSAASKGSQASKGSAVHVSQVRLGGDVGPPPDGASSGSRGSAHSNRSTTSAGGRPRPGVKPTTPRRKGTPILQPQVSRPA